MDSKIKLKKYSAIFYLLSIILIYIIIRISGIRMVFSNGKVYFIDTDPYYHMRRTLLILKHYPKVPIFDHYIAYPTGGNCIWPPLFDFSLASLIMLILGKSPNLYHAEMIAALFPVLLGAISLIPLYFITKHIFNEKISLLSCLVLVILPANINSSVLGKYDHHIAEILFSLLINLFFLLYLKEIYNWSRGFSPIKRKKVLTFSILCGLSIAFSFLFWHGSILLLFPIFSFLTIMIIISVAAGFSLRYSKANKNLCPVEKNETEISTPKLKNAGLINQALAILEYLLQYSFISFFSASITLFTFTYIFLPKKLNNLTYFSYEYFSYFQPFLLLTIANLILFVLIITRIFKYKNKKIILNLFLLTLCILIGYFIVEKTQVKTIENIKGGYFFFSKGNRWVKSIAESQPLLEFSPEINSSHAETTLSRIIFIIPVLIPFLIFKTIKENNKYIDYLFLILWTIINFTFALTQRRYGNIFSINCAILSGFTVILINDFLESSRKMIISSKKEEENGIQPSDCGKVYSKREDAINIIYTFWNKKYYQIFIFIFFIYLIFPSLKFVKKLYLIYTFDKEEYYIYDWIRAKTPKTSYYLEPDKKPEYGVLASNWSYGHHIEYISQRPTIINNFGTNILNFEKGVSLLFTKNEDEFIKKIKVLNIKYILVNPVSLDYYINILNLPRKNFNLSKKKLNTKKYYNIMHTRLYEYDGSIIKEKLNNKYFIIPALNHFRLIAESSFSDTKNIMGRFKIFEYVKGAKITGEATPFKKVFLLMEIKSNNGREFYYINSTKSDKNGNFEIISPYSTEENIYGDKFGRNAKIKCENKEININVPENNVINGNKIIYINLN